MRKAFARLLALVTMVQAGLAAGGSGYRWG